MRNVILVLVFMFSAMIASAQTASRKTTDSIAVLVQKYFNEKSAQKIYAMTSPTVHKKISYETFKNAFEKEFFPIGVMKEMTFLKDDKGSITYKLTFNTTSVCAMALLVNTKKQIEELNFMPYKKENGSKTNK